MTLKEIIEQEIEHLGPLFTDNRLAQSNAEDQLHIFARTIVEATLEDMKGQDDPQQHNKNVEKDVRLMSRGYNTRISEEQAKREEILKSL